ncbi:hypothetical protein ACOSQ3_027783 [Xanthoceras sorbifolium]
MRVKEEIEKDEHARIHKGKKPMKKVQMIHTMSGGPTMVGRSDKFRKSHVQMIPERNLGASLYTVPNDEPHKPRVAQIVFADEDSYDVIQPHDDPIVITLLVLDCPVAQVMVDTGSSVDILFKDALDKFNLESVILNSCTSPLYGFTGDSVIPIGLILAPRGDLPLDSSGDTKRLFANADSVYKGGSLHDIHPEMIFVVL